MHRTEQVLRRVEREIVVVSNLEMTIFVTSRNWYWDIKSVIKDCLSTANPKQLNSLN